MPINKVDVTTFDAYLKEWYVDEKNLYNVSMYNKPLLGMIKKSPKASGDLWVQPTTIANPLGVCADHASASANSTAGEHYKFTGTWKSQFSRVYLNDKVLSLSQDSRGAFKNAKSLIDSSASQFKTATALQLFRSEKGSIGRLSTMTGSLPAGGPLNFQEDDDNMTQFLNKNARLVFGAIDGANTSANRSVATVTKGTSAFTVNADGSQAIASQDYVTFDGNISGTLAGFESWVPQSAPTDTFKGVDRSVDPVGLGGLRLAAVGSNIQEAIIQAVSDLTQYGGSGNVACFIHPTKYADLVKELGTQAQYVKTPGKAFSKGDKVTFGYKALEVACGGITCPIYSDAHCQKELGWAVSLDVWCLESSGPWPKVKDLDGLKMLRQDSTNDYVSELVGYGEMICSAPQYNVVIKFNQ